jgi:hypothetical protein
MIDVSRKIAFEAFVRVIYRSPVDTGRFRANWGVQFGSPFAGYDEDARDTTPVFDRSGPTTAKAQWKTTEWNPRRGAVFLCNNTAYGLVLEYGRANGQPGSMQSPQGMVRVAIAEMQNGGAEAAAR